MRTTHASLQIACVCAELLPLLDLLPLLRRAARLIRASHDLQLDTGMLLAVPIPAAAAAEGAAIQQAIQESLQEADAKGIGGAEVRVC